MTKDEDDWISHFIEAVQASSRSSQAAAEKEFAAKLKLFTPRFERARASDAQGELAKQLTAITALAGEKKFEAAADTLDEAWALAGSLISAAAAAAMTPPEPATQEPAEEPAPEEVAVVAEELIVPASEPALPDVVSELDAPSAEDKVAPVEDELMGEEMSPSEEPGAAETGSLVAEEPARDLSEPAAETPNDAPDANTGDALADLTVPEESVADPTADETAAESIGEELSEEELLAHEKSADASPADEPLQAVEAISEVAPAMVEELPTKTAIDEPSDSLDATFAELDVLSEAAPVEELSAAGNEGEEARVSDEPAAEPLESLDVGLENEFADLSPAEAETESHVAEMPTAGDEPAEPLATEMSNANLDDLLSEVTTEEETPPEVTSSDDEPK